MGYACPVCADPQSDAAHLANHLAFTTMLRGGEHGEWLDEHVPRWEELDEKALGERVVEHAEETEFPQVFEDTTDGGSGSHDHDEGSHHHGAEGQGPADGRAGHVGPSGPGDLPAGADAFAGGGLDDEAREVIAEARELTRKRRESSDAAASGEGDEDTDETEGGGSDAGTETE